MLLLKISKAVENDEIYVVRNETKDLDIKVKLELDNRERILLLKGGLLNLIKSGV